MKKKIVVFLVVGVLALGLGVSLAYFTPIITGSGKEISLVAKELKVIYTDTSAINTGIIEPGWTVTKSFTVENKSDGLYKYNIVIENLLNTFETEGFLQYRILNEDTGFKCEWKDVPKTSEPINTVLAYSVEIEDKEIQSYTIEFRYLETEEDQSADMGKSFGGNIMIEVGTEEPSRGKLYDILLVDNPTINSRSDFSKAFEQAGLYKEENASYLEPDGNTKNVVYYFTGPVQNNWVKFGKEGTDDIWWRIIRTNEDGSVRLLYAGKGEEGHATTEGYIKASQKYNSSYDNTKYVGYMYGKEEGENQTLETDRLNETPSLIKTTIDSWYDTNMSKTDGQSHPYGSYLSRTAIYCNDRSTYKYVASSTMYYGASMRLTTNASNSTYGGVSSATSYHPTFKCGGNADGSETGLWANGGDVADRFTGTQKSATPVGNQLLADKPIALMTADEVAYAGGIYSNISENTYYYKNSNGGSVTGSTWWWTMSPSIANSSGYASVFVVYASYVPGFLSNDSVNGSYSVRPVVSLKSCVEVTGSGKTDDPYIPITISDTCVQADN